MGLSGQLISVFHQTALSHRVKSSRLLGGLARRWWDHEQSRRFAHAIDRLGPPIIPATHGQPTGIVHAPSPQEIRRRLPEIVSAGEEFSNEMAQWSYTDKFVSITQDPTSCGYQDIYAQVLRDIRHRRPRVLELGIGVNDPNARSGMGLGHQPGASLRGWSNYLPGSEVHGADIDDRCLVDTDQYSTHKVDQRDPSSLARLAAGLGPPLDFIVDDGLHTPAANGNSIAALLPLLSPWGIMVIEDIQPTFDHVWEDLIHRIRPEYACVFYPSRLLRQERLPDASGGIAVIARVD